MGDGVGSGWGSGCGDDGVVGEGEVALHEAKTKIFELSMLLDCNAEHGALLTSVGAGNKHDGWGHLAKLLEG